MSQKLDTILTDLTNYLAEEDIVDPIGYLETLQRQLQELAGQRATREELKSAIGEGIHKGLRINDVLDLWRAIQKLDGDTWDSVLDYTVYSLLFMNVVSVREGLES